MNAIPAAAHLSEADLVRHLDREGDAAEQDRRETHLRACDACAGRARQLGGQSDLVRAWLYRADHDHSPASLPTARRRAAAGPWLKAAIIVLLLAAPLAAVPPVRDWVAERIGLAGVRDPAPSALATAETPGRAAIRFTPQPGTFTVRLDAPVPGATLALGRADGTEAVLDVAPAEESEVGDAPVVSEDAVRLPATPDRRWELRVPASVDAVRVIAGGGALHVTAAALDAGRVVDLAVNR
jgi:hypothetical protein